MPKNDLEKRLIQGISDLEREIETLDRRREAVEARLEKLRALRAALQGVPSDLLSSLLGEEPATEEEPAGEPRGTNFERIAAFLREQDSPQTVAAIERGTGIARTSISAVLYRTHPQEFMSYDLAGPNRGRAKAWCLRDRVRDPGQREEESSAEPGDPTEGEGGLTADGDIPF